MPEPAGREGEADVGEERTPRVNMWEWGPKSKEYECS